MLSINSIGWNCNLEQTTHWGIQHCAMCSLSRLDRCRSVLIELSMVSRKRSWSRWDHVRLYAGANSNGKSTSKVISGKGCHTFLFTSRYYKSFRHFNRNVPKLLCDRQIFFSFNRNISQYYSLFSNFTFKFNFPVAFFSKTKFFSPTTKKWIKDLFFWKQ